MQVARVAGAVAQYPVLCAPEEVGIERVLGPRPADGGVVISDQLLRWAAVESTTPWVGRDGDRFPWLRLSFGHHHPLPLRAGGPEEPGQAGSMPVTFGAA